MCPPLLSPYYYYYYLNLAYHHHSWNHWVFHLFWAHLLNHALVKLTWGGICLLCVFFLPNVGFTLSSCVFMCVYVTWCCDQNECMDYGHNWRNKKNYICSQHMPWLHSSSCTHISPFIPYWQWNSTSQMIRSLRSCLLISLWI
jgi:hypothetical protein